MRQDYLKTRTISCRGEHLHWVRGLLIAHLRRDVKWNEMARILGVDNSRLGHIKAGLCRGGRGFTNRLIKAMREQGVMIHLSDFYDDDPIPAVPQISLPSQHRRRLHDSGSESDH